MITKHFDFLDWKKCRAFWDLVYPIDPNINLIICTEFYASGYWIEPKGSLKLDGVIFYQTDEEVQSLFKRIEQNEELRALGKHIRGLIV